jgi:hypothetical protein
MSNIKLVSMIAAEGERLRTELRAEATADIAVALEVIEEDLDAMQGKLDRLRAEVDQLKAGQASSSDAGS